MSLVKRDSFSEETHIGGNNAVSTDPLGRLCHILFSNPVVDKDGVMSKHARVALEWIYGIDD